MLAVLLAMGLAITSCVDSADETTDAENEADSQRRSAESADSAELEQIELAARPGPFQLTIDSRPDAVAPSAAIEAHDSSGSLVGSARFAASGSAIIRDLPPGEVEIRFGGDPGYRSQPFTIPGEDPPGPAFYGDSELVAGFNYLPTRDGTTLSAFVTLPGPIEDGPYPTLVEYSGYSPSDPTPNVDPYRLLLPGLGYALVQVNVRGTGCSGGSFDTFERIQSFDGYDVIETVAAQSWSANIGMFGVSYPGIMQLHVASTRPPSLSAIAPLSVTDGVDSVLYPGGIYNNGFGEEWTRRVGLRAQALGQPWSAELIEAGDKTCENNQLLRVHNPDLVATISAEPYVTPLSDSRSARTFAGDIAVPTFMAGAWQDEQTGGRFPSLLNDLTDVPVLRAVLYNGLHIDAVSAEMLTRLFDFLSIYVAEEAPKIEPISQLLIELALTVVFEEALTVPASRYEGLAVAEARALYESEPSIEVLFDQGAEQPNLPVPGFEARFDQWPPAETSATPLYLAGSGRSVTLDFERPQNELSIGFVTDPAEGDATTVGDRGLIWSKNPGWEWPKPSADNSVTATTAPLDDDLVLVGNLSADLWVSIDDPSGSAGTIDDADIEVTISEVAPDGSETYVQNGWLKVSQRALADDATELEPKISGVERSRLPLEPGAEPVLARVEVLPFAHAFRTGSRLRLTVDTPGASRPEWRFAVGETPVRVTIHSTADRPSRLLLPVITGLSVPTQRPACGVLRGQPCREP